MQNEKEKKNKIIQWKENYKYILNKYFDCFCYAKAKVKLPTLDSSPWWLSEIPTFPQLVSALLRLRQLRTGLL